MTQEETDWIVEDMADCYFDAMPRYFVVEVQLIPGARDEVRKWCREHLTTLLRDYPVVEELGIDYIRFVCFFAAMQEGKRILDGRP